MATTRNYNSHGVDHTQTVRYLSNQFRQKTETKGRNNVKGTELYQLQVDFSYLIQDLVCGFAYKHTKTIAQIQDFIDDIN